ncbi:Hypothetical predicted protein [Mytilus galloprovincialis]|uniref:Neuralized pats1 n=1 Tax=Mytilus galloprovincialis TaxID=29158 RepID=A0A8B6BXF5_MYTGA|nr:Hypothetical predicted protein [Mytilus galloprovincialis]
MKETYSKDLISKGDFASYENRVHLAGAMNIGKSSLASTLIGEKVPTAYHSTDGLVVHFGRIGIHLEDKKMIPFVQSDSNILHKIILEKPQRSTQTANYFQEICDGTYRIKVAPSDLIDFGGQRPFDMTHQLFIHHKGTFILMFDGRYRLNTPLKEYPQGDITAKDILVHWVNSILIYCQPGDDKMPIILFAATHSDVICADEISVKKKEFIDELTLLFQSHKQRKHIVCDRLFFIDATNRDDLEIELLKDALVDIAFKQPTWGNRISVAWVPLELQISEWRTNGINFLQKEEIKKFNESNPEFMMNETRLEEFLNLQHSLGKVIYIDQPGLQNFIVIQPKAMIKILRSFVTHEKLWPKDYELRVILASIATSGMVEKKQLLSLWSQPQFKQLLPSTEHKEYIIQVLLHFDILVEPKCDEESCETYLVPCLNVEISTD